MTTRSSTSGTESKQAPDLPFLSAASDGDATVYRNAHVQMGSPRQLVGKKSCIIQIRTSQEGGVNNKEETTLENHSAVAPPLSEDDFESLYEIPNVVCLRLNPANQQLTVEYTETAADDAELIFLCTTRILSGGEYNKSLMLIKDMPQAPHVTERQWQWLVPKEDNETRKEHSKQEAMDAIRYRTEHEKMLNGAAQTHYEVHALLSEAAKQLRDHTSRGSEARTFTVGMEAFLDTLEDVSATSSEERKKKIFSEEFVGTLNGNPTLTSSDTVFTLLTFKGQESNEESEIGHCLTLEFQPLSPEPNVLVHDATGGPAPSNTTLAICAFLKQQLGSHVGVTLDRGAVGSSAREGTLRNNCAGLGLGQYLHLALGQDSAWEEYFVEQAVVCQELLEDPTSIADRPEFLSGTAPVNCQFYTPTPAGHQAPDAHRCQMWLHPESEYFCFESPITGPNVLGLSKILSVVCTMETGHLQLNLVGGTVVCFTNFQDRAAFSRVSDTLRESLACVRPKQLYEADCLLGMTPREFGIYVQELQKILKTDATTTMLTKGKKISELLQRCQAAKVQGEATANQATDWERRNPEQRYMVGTGLVEANIPHPSVQIPQADICRICSARVPKTLRKLHLMDFWHSTQIEQLNQMHIRYTKVEETASPPATQVALTPPTPETKEQRREAKKLARAAGIKPFCDTCGMPVPEMMFYSHMQVCHKDSYFHLNGFKFDPIQPVLTEKQKEEQEKVRALVKRSHEQRALVAAGGGQTSERKEGEGEVVPVLESTPDPNKKAPTMSSYASHNNSRMGSRTGSQVVHRSAGDYDASHGASNGTTAPQSTVTSSRSLPSPNPSPKPQHERREVAAQTFTLSASALASIPRDPNAKDNAIREVSRVHWMKKK